MTETDSIGPTRPDNDWTGPDRASLARLRSLGWSPRVIFDVGASNGAWSDWIATVCPDAAYHCFEPLVHHVPEYRDRWAAVLQQHPTFTLHPVALQDRVGETVAHRFPNPFNSSTLPLEHQDAEVLPIRVPATTIDNLLASGVPTPSLLKIDVQGSELAILRGAELSLGAIDVLLLETWLWRGYEGKVPLLLELAMWLGQRDFYLWDVAGLQRDPSDVLTGMDCVFINARTMQPYMTYRAYRVSVAETLRKTFPRASPGPEPQRRTGS